MVTVSAEPLRTDAGGRFETTYPRGERAGLQLLSPDSDAIGSSGIAELGPSGAFDFGDLPLDPAQMQLVRLQALDGDPDWTAYLALEGEHHNSRHRVAFDAEGRVSLPSNGAGTAMTIRTPSGLRLAVRGRSSWRADEPLPVPIYVEDLAWIEVVDPNGERVHLDGSVRFYYENEHFHADGIAPIHAPGERVAIPRPAGSRVFLQWGEVGKMDRLASGEVEFPGEAGDVEAVLRLPGEPAFAEVVDASGRPADGVRVQVMSAQTDSVAGAVEDTDLEGRVRLDWLPEDPLVLLYRPRGGVHFLGRPAEPPALGETVTWTFDPAHSFQGVLRDGLGPVAFSELELRLEPRDVLVASARSTAGGRFEIPKLGAGRYRVAVRAAECFPLEVTIDLPSPDLELELRRTGGIELTVKDRDGHARAAAAVALTCIDLGETLEEWRQARRLVVPAPRTDSGGRWAVAGVPRGTYEVEVAGQRAVLEVLAGEVTQVELGEG